MVKILGEKYGFSILEFIKLIKECDPLQLEERQLFLEKVDEKDREIDKLIKQVVEQDDLINSLKAQIFQLDVRNGELSNQILMEKQALAGILNSRSWRAIQLFHKFKAFFLPKRK
jgi:hypothetical protein